MQPNTIPGDHPAPGERPEPVLIPNSGRLPHPFVYIRLMDSPGDEIDPAVRRKSAEYTQRRPAGVEWTQLSHITLVLTNAGDVASDVMRVDYQLLFCVDPSHQVDQGFTLGTLHAGEQSSDGQLVGDPLSVLKRSTVVPARGTASLPITVTPRAGLTLQELAKVYFRARVTSMGTRTTAPEQWDFASDPTVTEATFIVNSAGSP